MELLKRLGFWLLLPLVVPQALRTRRHARRFAPAAGPQAGTVGRGPHMELLSVGDSIVAGVGAATQSEALVGRFADALAGATGRTVRWMARGQVGIRAGTAAGLLASHEPSATVDLVLVSVGVNDVTGLRRTGAWRRDLARFLEEVHRRAPHAVVLVTGLPPLGGFPLLPQPLAWVLGLRAGVFDRAARAICRARPWCLFVATDFDPSAGQFAADGYHPNPASYDTWARELAHRAGPHLAPRP